ncbi:MAG: transposase [Xenococcaceae cyanobacterium MO_167.B52]|nr:transposase [Xenococcaceae cyanobacterium MO_167.B52]
MRAYSLDLRERIIASREEGTSIRKLAKQFKVSRGMVWNLIKLRQETGNIVPKPATGGKQSQLAGKEAELAAMVQQYPDYTLEEYCEYWDEHTGVRVSASTMCRELQKQRWTIKKNAT